MAKQLSLAWGFDLDDRKREHEWSQRPIYGRIMRFSRAAEEARPLLEFQNSLPVSHLSHLSGS